MAFIKLYPALFFTVFIIIFILSDPILFRPLGVIKDNIINYLR